MADRTPADAPADVPIDRGSGPALDDETVRTVRAEGRADDGANPPGDLADGEDFTDRKEAAGDGDLHAERHADEDLHQHLADDGGPDVDDEPVDRTLPTVRRAPNVEAMPIDEFPPPPPAAAAPDLEEDTEVVPAPDLEEDTEVVPAPDGAEAVAWALATSAADGAWASDDARAAGEGRVLPGAAAPSTRPGDGPDPERSDTAAEPSGTAAERSGTVAVKPDAFHAAALESDSGEPAAAGSDDGRPDGGRTAGRPARTPQHPVDGAEAARTTRGTAYVPGRHEVTMAAERSGWRTLARAVRPRMTTSQILVGLLCAVLGFALVVQLTQAPRDKLAGVRQSDLVRLLDETTQQADDLEGRVRGLEATRDRLRSGSDQQRAALELAETQAETQGILSGRLRAHGPGVRIEITDAAKVKAFALFNTLEELRNAGAEAIEVNDVRLVTTSSFVDSANGIVVDGRTIHPPYAWTAIGDPPTMETALEIPGGAMASVRADGAHTRIQQLTEVRIRAITEPSAPTYATPVPDRTTAGG